MSSIPVSGRDPPGLIGAVVRALIVPGECVRDKRPSVPGRLLLARPGRSGSPRYGRCRLPRAAPARLVPNMPTSRPCISSSKLALPSQVNSHEYRHTSFTIGSNSIPMEPVVLGGVAERRAQGGHVEADRRQVAEVGYGGDVDATLEHQSAGRPPAASPPPGRRGLRATRGTPAAWPPAWAGGCRPRPRTSRPRGWC